MAAPKLVAVAKADDAKITKAIQCVAGARGGYQVEYLDGGGDANGERRHKVPASGWYVLTHWVSVKIGRRDYDGKGAVGAVFKDGKLIGMEGQPGVPETDRDGSGPFEPMVKK